jgi:hypothetical protein
MNKAALIALVLAACHHHKQEVSGPVLLQSKTAETQPWITVSLTISGTEADDDKRDSCMDEAHEAGIQLQAGAPISGTLYFMDHDDYVEGPGTPKTVFGAMGSNGTCVLALAKLTKIDELVPMSKAEPAGCKPVGSVEGSNAGFMHRGSYDAAVVDAQFKARAAGGDKYVQDVTRDEGTRVIVNGRAFKCN